MTHAQISTFVRAIIQRHVDLLKESWVSVKTLIIRYCRQFLNKIDISGSNRLNKSLKMRKFSLAPTSVKWKFVTYVPDSLDYFGHHKGFVFMRADSNLFVMQLIMCEIKSSQHHVFMLLCGTLNTNKFIGEVDTHVGDNCFQFNYQ